MAKNPTRMWFDDNFLKTHAGQIIHDPDIAIIELVANSWDAGARIVKIFR